LWSCHTPNIYLPPTLSSLKVDTRRHTRFLSSVNKKNISGNRTSYCCLKGVAAKKGKGKKATEKGKRKNGTKKRKRKKTKGKRHRKKRLTNRKKGKMSKNRKKRQNNRKANRRLFRNLQVPPCIGTSSAAIHVIFFRRCDAATEVIDTHGPNLNVANTQ
jgi:hypothetical protein